MADQNENAEGVTITYQGKICGPPFDFTRSAGLEPDFGSVAMHKQDFQAFVITESIPGVDLLGPGVTQERPAGFLSAGRLVFQEFAPPKLGQPNELNKVGWDQILLTERGAQVAFPDDTEDNEVVRVELTDIRSLYKTRGFVDGWINIPRFGTAGVDASGATATGNGGAKAAASDGTTQPTIDLLKDLFGGEEPVANEPEFQALVKKLDDLSKPGADQGATVGTDLQKQYEALVAAQSFAPETFVKAQAKKPKQSSLATTDGPALIDGSSNLGAPWTVETILTKKIFPRLPGSPSLRIQSPRPALYDKIVGPKTWDVILAKEAFSQIMDEFQLIPVLNFDASWTIWEKGKGDLQIFNGITFKTFKTSDPNCDPRIASSRRLLAYKHVPACAVIVGSPKIKAARLRLEPVGVNRKGEVVPLVDALKDIGLTLETATRFAVLSHKERSALLDVTEEGLKEFDRWAFKFFRVPGGAEKHGDKLPMLKTTSVFDKIGQLLPLRIYSESFTVNDILDLRHRGSLSQAITKIADKEHQEEEIEKRLLHAEISSAEADQLRVKRDELQVDIQSLIAYIQGQLDVNAPQTETLKPSEKAFVDTLGSLAAAHNATALADHTAADIKAAAEAKANADKARRKSISETIAVAVQKANPQHYRVAVNVPFGEQCSGYEVDHEHGIVMFKTVQGHIFKEGVPLEGSYLQSGARVEVEFAYRVKPAFTEDLKISYRYFLAVARTTKSVGGQNVTGSEVRAEVPQGVAPLMIYHPELQQVINLDGTSNKALLDKIAERLGKEQVLVPQTTDGAIVDFCCPLAISNTGAVLSVQWSYGLDEIPRVTAHVGVYARLVGPDGVGRTRAFGGNGGLDDLDGGSLNGSVFSPRGPGR